MSLYDPYDVYLMRARFNLGSVPCPADQDVDGDVDQSDFGLFLRCLNEQPIPADPNCANP